MRLYDKSVLYYRSPPGTDLPTSVPWHMIPVRPRYRMQPQPGDVATRLSGGGGRRRLGYEVGAVTLGNHKSMCRVYRTVVKREITWSDTTVHVKLRLTNGAREDKPFEFARKALRLRLTHATRGGWSLDSFERSQIFAVRHENSDSTGTVMVATCMLVRQNGMQQTLLSYVCMK